MMQATATAVPSPERASARELHGTRTAAPRAQTADPWRHSPSKRCTLPHPGSRLVGLGLLLVVAMVGLGTPKGAYASQSRLQAAIDAYTQAMETPDRHVRVQRFSRAELLFRQVLEGDSQTPPLRNADLLVNLGNAALQAERLGPAIVAYRQALLLHPHHDQARQNLAFARSLVPDWIRRVETPGLLDTLLFWHAVFTPAQVALTASLCFLVAAIAFAWGYVSRLTLGRYLACAPLLAWGVLMASLWWDQADDSPREVVVVNETVLRSADSEHAISRLANALPSGAEVELLQRRDRWAELRLGGGRTGWVLSSALASVNE
jgi:tetratricopeptide (TPR) repeat protein